MNKSKPIPSPTKSAAEALKTQRAESKARNKIKALEWKEANTQSKKPKPGMFDPGKYKVWI
jgi:hypothetical protein